MSEELEVLKFITQSFNKEDIAYVISGSMAANYYSVPRMTRDRDVVIELSQKDIGKFINLFQRDFYVDEDMIRKEVLCKGMFNLIHNQHIIKIDFIMKKESKFQDFVFFRKKTVLIDNIPMCFISAEDLILAKLSWAKDPHSEIQLKDVSNILDSVNDLDKEYIEKRVCALGLAQIYQDVEEG